MVSSRTREASTLKVDSIPNRIKAASIPNRTKADSIPIKAADSTLIKEASALAVDLVRHQAVEHSRRLF